MLAERQQLHAVRMTKRRPFILATRGTQRVLVQIEILDAKHTKASRFQEALCQIRRKVTSGVTLPDSATAYRDCGHTRLCVTRRQATTKNI
jgi:hypothetical protein